MASGVRSASATQRGAGIGWVAVILCLIWTCLDWLVGNLYRLSNDGFLKQNGYADFDKY